MKPYLARNRAPILGIILLFSGSIILGLLIGAATYFISNVIYLIFVYSLAVGVATMIAFNKLLLFSKVRHSIIATLAGLLTGLLVSFAYYGTPYLITRNEYTNLYEQNRDMSTINTSDYFNRMLVKETGTSGFLGYLKLRAKMGDEYTGYFEINGVPIHIYSFTLKSSWAWLYWFIEIVFISLPSAYIGFEVGKRPFNESADDWYNPLPTIICAVPLDDKDRLLISFQEGRLHEISELSVSEEDIPHPKIEISEQQSKNKKGNILLSVNQTYRDEKLQIKRRSIGKWEVSDQEYISFTNWLNNKLTK